MEAVGLEALPAATLPGGPEEPAAEESAAPPDWVSFEWAATPAAEVPAAVDAAPAEAPPVEAPVREVAPRDAPAIVAASVEAPVLEAALVEPPAIVAVPAEEPVMEAAPVEPPAIVAAPVEEPAIEVAMHEPRALELTVTEDTELSFSSMPMSAVELAGADKLLALGGEDELPIGEPSAGPPPIEEAALEVAPAEVPNAPPVAAAVPQGAAGPRAQPDTLLFGVSLTAAAVAAQSQRRAASSALSDSTGVAEQGSVVSANTPRAPPADSSAAASEAPRSSSYAVYPHFAAGPVPGFTGGCAASDARQIEMRSAVDPFALDPVTALAIERNAQPAAFSIGESSPPMMGVLSTESRHSVSAVDPEAFKVLLTVRHAHRRAEGQFPGTMFCMQEAPLQLVHVTGISCCTL